MDVRLAAVCDVCGATYVAYIPREQFEVSNGEAELIVFPRCWVHAGKSMDVLAPQEFSARRK